jgi:hypothetical protein
MKKIFLSEQILNHAIELEAARRKPPLDEKGVSLNWENGNKTYSDWILRYGYLLIDDCLRNKQNIREKELQDIKKATKYYIFIPNQIVKSHAVVGYHYKGEELGFLDVPVSIFKGQTIPNNFIVSQSCKNLYDRDYNLVLLYSDLTFYSPIDFLKMPIE